MDIEFDPAKNQANIDKHGVSLEMAGHIEWSNVLCMPDARRDYGEVREIGFTVIGHDVSKVLVDALNAGKMPIVEPQLNELIAANRERLSATMDANEAIQKSDATFVIVPTPSDSTGFFSNRFVLQAMETLGKALRNKKGYHMINITSTVMPGSTGGEIKAALEAASGRKVGPELGLCYNPEFIALGSVVRDMRSARAASALT